MMSDMIIQLNVFFVIVLLMIIIIFVSLGFILANKMNNKLNNLYMEIIDNNEKIIDSYKTENLLYKSQMEEK